MNGRAPVTISDDKGCCFQNECQCTLCSLENYNIRNECAMQLITSLVHVLHWSFHVSCLSCAGVCNIFGGNYITFDGKSYNFSKSCKYYLVKEIINKYNLTITVENGCDTSNTILCTDTLTVIYGSTEVVFKTQLVNISTPVLEVRDSTMQAF